MLACAFASHGYGGWPRAQDRKLDTARLYIDDSDLTHIDYSHSAVPNISDSCIPQYASTNASSRHSVVLLDIDYLRADISPHVVAIVNVAVDVVRLVVDRILVAHCSDHLEQVHQREGRHHRLRQSRRFVAAVVA